MKNKAEYYLQREMSNESQLYESGTLITGKNWKGTFNYFFLNPSSIHGESTNEVFRLSIPLLLHI